MLTIDQRKLISLRREEANACIHFGLLHAGTLTACSGIEMLLKTLYDELISKLDKDDQFLANELRAILIEMTGDNDRQIDLGLGGWIRFYADNNLISELRNHFEYIFSDFNLHTLHLANQEWVKCKHHHYQVTHEKALMINNYLNAFLDETRNLDGGDTTQVRTVGEFGEHWLEQWETEIRKWFIQNRNTPQANILQPLPKLLALVVSLIVDSSVPIELKTHLMVAANYVFSSVDLMPEDDLDVRGLVDDSAVLVLTLFWLWRHRGLQEDLIRLHWQADSDIIVEIGKLERYIRENNEVLFKDARLKFGDNLVWAAIRRVSKEGPDALWRNYWKEAY